MKKAKVKKATKKYIDTNNLVMEIGKNGEPVEIGMAVRVHSKKALGVEMVCGETIPYREGITKGTSILICEKCEKKLLQWQVKASGQQLSLF
jgi:hypothetical protein